MISFGTPDGVVIIEGMEAYASTELADDWIVTAEIHDQLPVTPEGPWIQTVIDESRPEMTIVTFALASRRTDFWTHPPQLATSVREAMEAIYWRPAGAR